MSESLLVFAADPGAPVDDVRRLLREMVAAAADAGAGSMHRTDDGTGGRTWAIFGDLGGSAEENARCVEHDLLGRQAVRLAIDQIVAVGGTRSVRALHQGAVMEGSWGEEAAFYATPDEFVAALTETAGTADAPRGGDVVLLAGDGELIDAVLAHWDSAQPEPVVRAGFADGTD